MAGWSPGRPGAKSEELIAMARNWESRRRRLLAHVSFCDDTGEVRTPDRRAELARQRVRDQVERYLGPALR
jgi:hypothetical protein